MGILTCKKGVLKLVHPGRYVEIHKQPITAAEVMSKNPRHCITRPDVFEYPWIVVKPESVLKLGRVFLIVPHRTIYELLKSRGHCNQLSQLPNSLDIETHDCPDVDQTLPFKLCPGMNLGCQRDRDSYTEFRAKKLKDSMTDIRSFDERDHLLSDSTNEELSENGDGDPQFGNSKKVTMARSCLRKQTSVYRIGSFSGLFRPAN